MEDFEDFKKQHILDVKERIKRLEGNLEKFKLTKSRIHIPTAHQIEKLSKKKKKGWKKALENYEKFLSYEEKTEAYLKADKRELEAYTSAKSYDDIIELTCQECGEHIYGMVCDLCGHNNHDLSKILKTIKEELLHSEKLGIPVSEFERTAIKRYENLIMRKKQNDSIEQFVLDMLYSSGSCKTCKKPLNDVICENCGADNKEHKKDTLKRGAKQFSEHYNVPFQEAAEIIHEKMLKLKNEGKINFVY